VECACTAKKTEKQDKTKKRKKKRRSEMKEKLKRLVAREGTPLQAALLTTIFVRQFFALRHTSPIMNAWKRRSPQL